MERETIDFLIKDKTFRLYVECGITHPDKNIKLYFMLKLVHMYINTHLKKCSYYRFLALVFSAMHYFSLSSSEIKNMLGIKMKNIPTNKYSYIFSDAIKHVVADIV